MTRCKNDIFLKMISKNPLNKETVVSFNALSSLPDCRLILAKAFLSNSGATEWNRLEKPVNRYECNFAGCLTGTQHFSANGYGVYRIWGEDTTEWADGIITMYAKPNTATAGTITVTISADSAFTNADVYEIEYASTDIKDDGFVPITVDLAKTPDDEEGTGWTPSAIGAYIKIATSVAGGISSIAIFEDIEDFVINDTVQIMCLSGIDGTDDLDTIENECMKGGYDKSTDSPIERTITGKILTPNYWKLNPRAGKGDKTKAWEQTTAKYTVASYDGGAFGIVSLEDKYADECGFIKAQMLGTCTAEDSEMEMLSVAGEYALDVTQFVVNGNDIIVNASLIGEELIVTYPREATVTNHHRYSMDNVGKTRYRMAYETVSSDGVKTHHQIDDVLITSFPMSISNEETEFEFTIAIQRGVNGINYETWEVIG